MSEATALKVNGLSKRFGGLVAVDQLTFSVCENELVGLIGPNGSGKTTVINLISGALSPTAGQIVLGDQLISNCSARTIARAGVARTFQLVRLLPTLTVLENVMIGSVFGHKRLWGQELHDHAARHLKELGMSHAVDSPIAALTYIDAKRVELARALASEPKLLLLDEWLAGLNPTELQTGIELIKALRDEGHTIILVEHVMDAIRSLCDRCVVVSSGIKIAEGTPEEALANKEVIRAYLGDQDA